MFIYIYIQSGHRFSTHSERLTVDGVSGSTLYRKVRRGEDFYLEVDVAHLMNASDVSYTGGAVYWKMKAREVNGYISKFSGKRWLSQYTRWQQNTIGIPTDVLAVPVNERVPRGGRVLSTHNARKTSKSTHFMPVPVILPKAMALWYKICPVTGMGRPLTMKAACLIVNPQKIVVNPFFQNLEKKLT